MNFGPHDSLLLANKFVGISKMYKNEKKGTYQTKNCEFSLCSYVDEEKFVTGNVKFDMTKLIDQPKVKKELDMGSGIKIFFKLQVSDTHKLVDPDLFEKETSENMEEETDVQKALNDEESFVIGDEEEKKPIEKILSFEDLKD